MGKWRYVTLTSKELARCRIQAVALSIVVLLLAIGLVYIMNVVALMVVGV